MIAGSQPTPTTTDRAAFRIKKIDPKWFEGFPQFEPAYALGIAKLAINVAAKAGRKGFAAETIKYYAKGTITKIEVILELLCEYRFLVSKNSRERFWICESAFALANGQQSPDWAMPLGWDERRWDGAPKSLRDKREAGWVIEIGAAFVSNEPGDRVPSPEDGVVARGAGYRRGPRGAEAAGKFGENAPTTEALTGDVRLADAKPAEARIDPLPAAKLEDISAYIDESFVSEVLGGARGAHRKREEIDTSALPTMADAAGGELEVDDGEPEALPPIAEPTAAAGRRGRLKPEAEVEALDVEAPKMTEREKKGIGGVKGSKKTNEKREKETVVGPPRLFVVLDPTVPSAFSGEVDHHSALDRLSERVREFSDEPWAVIRKVLAEVNGNEHAAVGLLAKRIQALSKEVTQYVPPDRVQSWAEHLAGLAESQAPGSGKKTDFRLANATIRFIMRFMTRHFVPLGEIAMSMEEMLEARAERDHARMQAEIDRLRGEIEAMKAAMR